MTTGNNLIITSNTDITKDSRTGLTLPLRTLRELSALAKTRARKPSRVEVLGEVCAIRLTRGLVAICDASDAHAVNGLSWQSQVSKGGTYAKTNITMADGKRIVVMMHTLLTGYEFTDHIDGDGLNNRRSNLRAATRSENNRNSRMQKNNRSGRKGVSRARSGKWIARIAVDGRQIYLGRFQTMDDAHYAYCEASRKLHGEFGRSE